MNYVKHLNLFGVDAKPIPCDVGEGAPSTSTVGAVGCFYMDTLTSDIYKCISAADDMYIWEPFGNGSGGTTITDKIDPKLLPEGGFGYTENGMGLLINQTVDGFDVMSDPIYAVTGPFEMDLVVGDTYTVVWDGVSYEVECKFNENNGMTYVGNENYLTMQPGGEIPFCILEAMEILYVATESTASSHTIEVYGNGEIVHKINPQFLPDGVGYEERGITTLIDKTAYIDSDELYTTISEELTFIDGQTYVVTFNGIEYTCVAWVNDDGAIILGNGDIYGGSGMGDDVPFSCDSYDDGSCYLNVESTGEYSIKIDGPKHVIHKIDAKYLDINIPNIYMSDEDLVAGESDLESGAIYLVYE